MHESMDRLTVLVIPYTTSTEVAKLEERVAIVSKYKHKFEIEDLGNCLYLLSRYKN